MAKVPIIGTFLPRLVQRARRSTVRLMEALLQPRWVHRARSSTMRLAPARPGEALLQPRGVNKHRCISRSVSGACAEAFTLLELLVVIAVLGLLAALLFPALGGAMRSSHRSVCASNIRQLAMANMMHAADQGFYVAAAEDVWTKNLKRWHGARAMRSAPFNMEESPLRPYLGEEARIKDCPAFRIKEPGFEAGCGGYGYNARGVGSQAYWVGLQAGSARGMPAGSIAQPAQTVMFTDAAFVESARGKTRMIEYSFSEAYYHLADNRPQETYQAQPSIHFRHDGIANVAWADGHVSQERQTLSFSAAFDAAHVGWFGPADNTLFDPF